MNKSTTTFKKAITSAVLAGAALLIASSSLMTVNADRYDDQIRALQNELNGYQAQADRFRAEADTLQNQLNIINAEKAALQAQIDVNQAKYDQLVVKIKETEDKIAQMRKVLGEVLADLYVDSEVSPLEMIATSKSMSDYMDKQQYQNTIRNRLNASIKQIKELKAELDRQKQEVENVLAEQNGQKQQLAAREAEQAKLVAETRGQESAYSSLVQQRSAEIQRVRDAQEAAYASARNSWNGGYVTVGGSSYAYDGQGLTKGCVGSCADPWRLYKGQCVSYVAWKLDAMGYKVYTFDGMGNAAEWPSTTTDYWASLYGRGNAAQRRYSPAPGYAAVNPNIASPYGHVMYVERINGDGTIRVSEYNFYAADTYSVRDISPGGLIYLEFARK